MPDAKQSGSSPEYERPPVVETILGVQFDRLPGFRNAHLRAFWKTLDASEWPDISDAPLLRPQFEQFADGAKWAKGVQVKVTQDPACRLQITNKNGDRMIQLQNSRLHFNWLGEGGSEYPRYEAKVRDEFVWALQCFTDFVTSEQLGDFRPNQWEVTYLNHIPKGTVWNTPNDWGFFLPLHGVPTVEHVAQRESFSGAWHFLIPDERGRLHVQWQHTVKSEPEQQEMIVLTLTARGPIDKGEDVLKGIRDGLDLGHKTIVRSFEKLMSDDANRYWGLKHAASR